MEKKGDAHRNTQNDDIITQLQTQELSKKQKKTGSQERTRALSFLLFETMPLRKDKEQAWCCWGDLQLTIYAPAWIHTSVNLKTVYQKGRSWSIMMTLWSSLTTLSIAVDFPVLQYSDSCLNCQGKRKIGYQDTKVGQSSEPGFIMDWIEEPLWGEWEDKQEDNIFSFTSLRFLLQLLLARGSDWREK